MSRLYRHSVAALLLGGVCLAQALAATLPTSFSETLVASGLSNPTAMAFAPDGRLLVCLQGGQVRVIENGTILATPFVSITVDSAGERGLLGLAFDPNFATNHYVYIYYTATTPATHNRVSRFVANGNVALGGSETVILDLDNLSGATNHNGGALHFGIDGKLYIGVGENATPANAQSLNNLLGKILRINADGTIPTDNPFFTQTAGRNRAIWALGLRNPYTFAFQPLSGRMLINDVGQNTFEEINDGFAGFNYGWPDSEGPTSNPNQTGPIYYYPHSGGAIAGCAITGGRSTTRIRCSFLPHRENRSQHRCVRVWRWQRLDAHWHRHDTVQRHGLCWTCCDEPPRRRAVLRGHGQRDGGRKLVRHGGSPEVERLWPAAGMRDWGIGIRVTRR